MIYYSLMLRRQLKAQTKKKAGAKRTLTAKKPVKAAPRKRTGKRSGKRKAVRRQIAKPVSSFAVVAATAPVSASRQPISHFGVRMLSLVLLLAAALTSNVTIALAGYDLDRAEQQAQLALSQVEPRAYLYRVASERRLDYPLLERIAHCESSWRMVRNSQSSAYGYFQILDATERHTPQYKEGRRKFDPIANIDMAVYLFERYGSMPWSESRPCWGWME